MHLLVLLAALHTDGALLRDDTGGTVILRGLNVAGNAKVPPFRPIGDPALLDPMARWGVNVLRLLFIWEAFEPQPGVYDQSYLDYYTGVVEAAGARGLSVIVDFHQDAFSRFSLGGCGEGFPEWALPPTVTRATPDNGSNCIDWIKRVAVDPQLAATWSAFFADTYGARTRWLQMIARVAGALAAEPAVIGYDMLNEPGGDEPTQIGPLYEDAARAIRAVHPGAILFVSPAVLTSAGKQTQLARPGFDNFVYSPHYYDPVITLAHSWSGSDESPTFELLNGKVAEWNVPLFLGEYGAPPSASDVTGFLDAMGKQLDLALASAAQWVYTPGWSAAALDGWNAEDFSVVDDHLVERDNFHPRPFPRRVAGTPIAFTLFADRLELFWQNDPSAGATELFAPPFYFGAPMQIAADADVRCTRDDRLVHCSSGATGVKHVTLFAGAACGLTGAEAMLLALTCTFLRRRTFRSRRSCSRRRSSADRSADRRTTDSTW